jgi:hypothetical protein
MQVLDFSTLNLKVKMLHNLCIFMSVPGAGAPYGVFPSQAQLYAAAAAAQGPPPTYDQSLAHPAAASAAAAVNQQVGFKTLNYLSYITRRQKIEAASNTT